MNYYESIFFFKMQIGTQYIYKIFQKKTLGAQTHCPQYRSRSCNLRYEDDDKQFFFLLQKYRGQKKIENWFLDSLNFKIE